MRNILLTSVLLISVLTLAAQSAGTKTEPFDFILSANANIQKKIVGGFYAYIGEEIGSRDNVTEFSSFKTKAGLSYKPIPYFKIAADYTFYAIWHDANSRHDTKFWDLRHRFRFHVNGIYEYYGWEFSIREIFQTTTYTEDINTYQQPQTLMVLRSRLKVAYECRSQPITPYVSCEVMNTLNAARFDSERTKVTYDDVYVNKVRSTLGVVYQPAKCHFLDFSLLYDWKYKKEWDATRKGEFKSLTYVTGNSLNLSVGYTFIF